MSKESPKITLSAKVEEEAATVFLRDFAKLFAKVLHRLFVDFIIKEGEVNELKSRFQKTYGINARMFNSIFYELKAKWAARQAQYDGTIKLYRNKIASHKAWIQKKSKEIDKREKKLAKLLDYQIRKKAHTNTGKGRKPVMTQVLKAIQANSLRSEIQSYKKKIGHKKTRINTLEGKLAKTTERQASRSLCFGGEKLFKKQHHLDKTEFDSHEEWAAFADLQKTGSSFWIGASCEKAGNLNAQYDFDQKCVRLRTPAAFGMVEKTVKVPLVFSDKQEQLLRQARDEGRQVNFRFVEKAKRTRSGNLVKNFLEGKFQGLQTEMFCHATIDAPEAADQKTHMCRGTIGLDLNKDHIALVETDASGNPVGNRNYPFLEKGCTSNQQEAVLGDHIADICDLAVSRGKTIVIEDLEFESKKKHLKLAGKGPGYNRMLSSFLYSKFKKALLSRARKTGVEVRSVNPAYTSIIGACKFSGYVHLSDHQKAALVIARRARRFSHRVSTVLCPSAAASMQVSQSQSAYHELFKSHVRPKNFWISNAKKIREQIRDDWQKVAYNKTPINPSRPSGMQAILTATLGDKGHSDCNSVYRVLSDWCKHGGVSSSFV